MTVTTQGDLFAQAAIEDAEENADARWLTAARSVTMQVAHELATFTTDDVWAELDRREVPRPREPRVLGAVTRALSRARFMVQTGEYVKSTRPETHSRPIPVWRAL